MTASGIKALIIWVTTFLILGLGLSVARAGDFEDESGILCQYIDWFHRNVKPVRSEMAKEVVPTVVKYSHEYAVDPLLVACLISWESSWRPRPGALGERGPMQVMPGKWSLRFDLDTLDGQMEAGIARLSLAFEKCGTLERALTHYASGSCVSKSERTQRKIRYRVRYYQKVNEKFRGEK